MVIHIENKVFVTTFLQLFREKLQIRYGKLHICPTSYHITPTPYAGMQEGGMGNMRQDVGRICSFP